jgi:putative serine protease PepD
VNSSGSRTPLLVAGLVAALGLGAGGGAAAYAVLADDSETVVSQVTVTDSEPAATTGLAISEIYERTQEGVVEISGGGTFGGGAQSQGSGFVYDDEGHIVTNQHVVAGASRITVRFSDGSTRNARVVGTDPSTDLAVIKVNAPASALTALRLGDSSKVRVGDSVVALGSPFGLEGSITSGIVSALHRQMTAPNNFTILDSIQTDAAINHGNSGGPLLDSRGRVIGVNAQIESESGGSDGVGFAIPSNTVRAIVSQIVETGEAEHAYLGVEMVPTPDGVAITNVLDGTPADRAGLKEATGTRTVDGERIPSGGDVIVEFDGVPIETSAELQSAVDAHRPGDEVEVVVVRDGDRRTVDITLDERPERLPGG